MRSPRKVVEWIHHVNVTSIIYMLLTKVTLSIASFQKIHRRNVGSVWRYLNHVWHMLPRLNISTAGSQYHRRQSHHQQEATVWLIFIFLYSDTNVAVHILGGPPCSKLQKRFFASIYITQTLDSSKQQLQSFSCKIIQDFSISLSYIPQSGCPGNLHGKKKTYQRQKKVKHNQQHQQHKKWLGM